MNANLATSVATRLARLDADAALNSEQVPLESIVPGVVERVHLFSSFDDDLDAVDYFVHFDDPETPCA